MNKEIPAQKQQINNNIGTRTKKSMISQSMK
jgi:hypothetical protein